MVLDAHFWTETFPALDLNNSEVRQQLFNAITTTEDFNTIHQSFFTRISPSRLSGLELLFKKAEGMSEEIVAELDSPSVKIELSEESKKHLHTLLEEEPAEIESTETDIKQSSIILATEVASKNLDDFLLQIINNLLKKSIDDQQDDYLKMMLLSSCHLLRRSAIQIILENEVNKDHLYSVADSREATVFQHLMVAIFKEPNEIANFLLSVWQKFVLPIQANRLVVTAITQDFFNAFTCIKDPEFMWKLLSNLTSEETIFQWMMEPFLFHGILTSSFEGFIYEHIKNSVDEIPEEKRIAYFSDKIQVLRSLVQYSVSESSEGTQWLQRIAQIYLTQVAVAMDNVRKAKNGQDFWKAWKEWETETVNAQLPDELIKAQKGQLTQWEENKFLRALDLLGNYKTYQQESFAKYAKCMSLSELMNYLQLPWQRDKMIQYRTNPSYCGNQDIIQFIIEKYTSEQSETTDILSYCQDGYKQCNSDNTKIICLLGILGCESDVKNNLPLCWFIAKSLFTIVNYEYRIKRYSSIGEILRTARDYSDKQGNRLLNMCLEFLESTCNVDKNSVGYSMNHMNPECSTAKRIDKRKKANASSLTELPGVESQAPNLETLKDFLKPVSLLKGMRDSMFGKSEAQGNGRNTVAATDGARRTTYRSGSYEDL